MRGWESSFNARDLYSDVRPCFARLKEDGYVVGIAGNQTARAGRFIRELNLPSDFVLTSDDIGAEKPDPAFFKPVIEHTGFDASEVAYVGDRVENDILPARDAGLATVPLRRGPWAIVNEDSPEAASADVRLTSLEGLPSTLMTLDSDEAAPSH
jgi:HAD superfamily hydrolase (TIGR01662 family)